MTNESIKNPYLRGLLARELLGYRKTYWTAARRNAGFDPKPTYLNKRVACRRSFACVDLHLRRHHEALVWGDPSPLADYPAGFAGH